MRTFAILVLALSLVGCGLFKQIGRTVNDAASILCNLAAADMEAESPEVLHGLSPADYCAIHEHLEPFIEEALAAQRAGQIKMQAPEAGSGKPAGAGAL